MSKRYSRIKHLMITSILTGITAVALPAMAASDVKAPAGAVSDDKGFYASGRILIKGKPGLGESKFLDILAKKGGKSERKIDKIDVHIVNVPPGLEKKIIAELQADPSIDFAELDRYVEPTFVPNDPYFSSEWHHTNIKSDGAWDISSGDGIIIAILDSGVDVTHPDLAANIVPGWNFYDNNSNTADVFGHGTKVAGAAAAISNNTTGVAGVAGAAKIMPVRISDATGYAYYSTIASGLTYAADHGARVANSSIAGTFTSAAVISAAEYMKSKGGLLTVSAGNSNVNESSTFVDSMIVASATDSANNKASWSSFGEMVSVAAPGVGIYTTSNGGGYGAFSGTSYSAPITAGVVANMMAANPNLGPTQIQNILYSTAVDLGDPGKDIYYGYGRVDAAAAVAAAKTAVVADTTLPTAAIASPAGGATLKGVVPVEVNATDNMSVSKVELLVNGALYATDISAPYSFAWDTTSLGNLSGVTLTAKAYDAVGNIGNAAAVKVNVMNVVDAVAPVPSITSPANGATVSGNVAIRANATDDIAVASMTLYLDGKRVASSTAASISYTWNARKASAGNHTIIAEAIDSSGNKAQTSIIVKR